MSKATARAAAVAGALLLSVLTAPAAVAGPDQSDRPAPGGASAEHRNDDDAPGRETSARERDADAASEPAAASASDSTDAPLDEPQPASNADFSGNGANQHGPYDSTRDGSPSDNGQGDGQATGRPCAGCVGKADNKNPQGQLPNATDDGNAGYECDTNSGIARTTPAHTGCTLAASTPPPTGGTSTPTGGASVLGVTLTAPAPSPAAAVAPAAVAPAAVEATVRSSALAATGPGGDLAQASLLATALLVFGALLLARTRLSSY